MPDDDAPVVDYLPPGSRTRRLYEQAVAWWRFIVARYPDIPPPELPPRPEPLTDGRHVGAHDGAAIRANMEANLLWEGRLAEWVDRVRPYPPPR